MLRGPKMGVAASVAFFHAAVDVDDALTELVDEEVERDGRTETDAAVDAVDVLLAKDETLLPELVLKGFFEHGARPKGDGDGTV